MAVNREDTAVRSYLETTFKAFAVSLAGVYILGYVVTENYLARYGIVEFELFNARMIGAGLLTVFLLLFVIVPPYFFLLDRRHNQPSYKRITTLWDRLLLLTLFQTGTFSALTLILDIEKSRVGSLCLAALTAVGYFGALEMARKQASGRHCNKYEVSFLTTIALVLLAALHWKSPVSFRFILSLGFAEVAIGGPLLVSRSRNLKIRAIAYTLGILLSVSFFFSIYLSYIFSEVRPSWGGGAPYRIILGNDKQSGILAPCPSREVQLIDQNDTGYYISLRRDTSKTYDAFFVPKDRVSGIFFLARDVEGITTNSLQQQVFPTSEDPSSCNAVKHLAVNK